MSKLTLKIPETEADHKKLGAQLTSQYERACAGMVEYVTFGALAQNVREAINSTRGIDTRPGGKDSKGTGLKAWLAAYAPAVTHPTALRYIDIAESVKAEFSLGESVDLYRLMKGDGLDAKEKARREKITAFIEGKSQRQLLISIGKFDPPSKATRTKKLTEEEKNQEFIDNARQTALSAFAELHVMQDRWKLLKDSQIRLAIENAERFAKQAKKWLETPAPSRGEFEAARYVKGEMDEELNKLRDQFDKTEVEENG